MKSLHSFGQIRRRGAALVATLAILVLLLGLTIAMFLSAANERRSASLYKNSQGLSELSESAVNLVMAQIKDATSLTASNAPAQRLTWASQPGMIRTYGADTNAVASYKLYSWSNPRPSGDANDSVPADWFANSAAYVDLNEPVADSSNPANLAAYRYPIAYPPLPSTDPTAPAGYSVDAGAPLASGGSFNNPVPMPVQWLYVLQDGTMAYPSSFSGSTATITEASSTNPVVGRVAYWTDDETSKVNLNTAAGGEYWAQPVQKTARQVENANWQPTRWEFQRYPGHPARTDLMKIFPPVFFGYANDPNGILQTRRKLWELIPRVSDNGATPQTALTTRPSDVAYDTDRLFASVGEVRFAANPPASGEREDFETTSVWRDRIEQLGFLTTTASRAPETTAFGTPRVSLWPLSSVNTPQKRTTLDQLIAVASTIQNTGSLNSPFGYYFVRSAKNPTAAVADVSANGPIFEYLEAMSDLSPKGFGAGTLVSKYGAPGRDQILTQMYDYVRTVNKLDKGLPNSNADSFARWTDVAPSVRTVGGETTRGFGRFPTVNQIAIHFICTADAGVPASNDPANRSLWSSNTASSFTALSAGQKNIMALVYLEVALPATGFPSLRYNDIGFQISGLDSWTLNGISLGFPASVTVSPLNASPANVSNINVGFAGGPLKYLAFIIQNNGTAPVLRRRGGLGFVSGSYPLASDAIRVSGSEMTFRPSPLTVGVTGYTDGAVGHTVTIPWTDPMQLPVPNLVPASNRWVFDAEGWNGSSEGRFPTNNPVGFEASRLFFPNDDTLVAMAVKHADYRLSMARPNDPSQWEVVSPLTAPRFAHRLANFSGSNAVPQSNYDPRVFGIIDPVNDLPRPAVPTPTHFASLGLPGPLTYGDFNNGLPLVACGPFINSPDEVGGWSTAGGPTAGIGFYWEAGLAESHIIDAYHTPNRKIASGIAFGSLPSAVEQGTPWLNLLFRPAPGVDHPGEAGFSISGASTPPAPADFHWLDFFWMPIVEPYAISENFSTAGKVNMNYRIAPFSYIRRTTGIEAVLGSAGITAVPSTPSSYQYPLAGQNNKFRKDYSGPSGSSAAHAFEGIFKANMTETLIGFDNRLGANSLFRSVGELCELPIVPDAPGATFASLSGGAWWNNFRLTGDDTREATYNDLYPRLTTRSNTYTVHYRVQVLKKRAGSPANQWSEGSDIVLSESRGSTLIERFLDPNAIYPNYATSFNSAESLDAFYRFRVLRRSEFTP